MTEKVPPQTSAEQREELARLAEAMAEENGDFGFFGSRVTALLADLAAKEAECQRLRERAEVAEKAVELAAKSDDPYCSGRCPVFRDKSACKQENRHNSPECIQARKKWAMGQARAALGVAPEPQS